MKKILVPTDFSGYGLTATHIAASLAEKTHASIILQHNVPTLLKWSCMSPEEHRRYPDVLERTNNSENKLSDLMTNYNLQHLDVSKVITQGVTYEKIVQEAYLEGVDLIVIGSHGNEEQGRSFIGSNIQKVMREAPCPVMTIKKELRPPAWRTVVVPFSMDEDITKAFQKIRSLASELGSVIHLLHVNTPTSFRNERQIKSQMEQFAMRYPEQKIETAIYSHRDVETGIIEYSQDVKADWIAMVTHDRKHKEKYLVGTTEIIAFKSNLPLLTVVLN